MVDLVSGAVGLGAGVLLGRLVIPQSEPFDVPVLMSVESRFPASDLLTELAAAGIEYRNGTFEIPVAVEQGKMGQVSIVQVQKSKADAAKSVIQQWLQRWKSVSMRGSSSLRR